MRKGNGDGTVPLISLGLHCRKGWRTKALNPAGFPVVTHELKHDAVPMYQDPRHDVALHVLLRPKGKRAVLASSCLCASLQVQL